MMDETNFSEEIFGFHAQRGTELALKAWVSLIGERYERTHSVAELMAILNSAGITDVQPYTHLASLTPYAVKYIYQEIEDPTMDRQYIASEVQALANLVESLLQQAEQATGRHLAIPHHAARPPKQKENAPCEASAQRLPSLGGVVP